MRDLIKDILDVLRRAALRILSPSTYNYEGVVVPFSASPQLAQSRKRIYTGRYEREEIKGIRAIVRPDDVVAEFGAGCGIVSTIIAKKLSNSANLHCFEGNPQVIPTTKRVFEINGIKPTLYPKVVASEAGFMEMFVYDQFESSSLVDRKKQGMKVQVEAAAIDQVLSALAPTVLMVDIEGAETFFIGMTIPPTVRAVCLELHPHVIGDDRASDIVKNFLDQGFYLLLELTGNKVVTMERHTIPS